MNLRKTELLFSWYIWQKLVVMRFFSIIDFLFLYSEKQINRANEIPLSSFLFADDCAAMSSASMYNFSRFFTSYFTTKNKNSATGLSLYVSKMIIEKHYNGVLDVNSEDQKTLFKIKSQVIL